MNFTLTGTEKNRWVNFSLVHLLVCYRQLTHLLAHSWTEGQNQSVSFSRSDVSESVEQGKGTVYVQH